MTFAPGVTAATVAVTVRGDVDVEASELVVVAFHSPVNARLGGDWGLGLGLVEDDDAG